MVRKIESIMHLKWRKIPEVRNFNGTEKGCSQGFDNKGKNESTSPIIFLRSLSPQSETLDNPCFRK
jgi:hypothetical protein